MVFLLLAWPSHETGKSRCTTESTPLFSGFSAKTPARALARRHAMLPRRDSTTNCQDFRGQQGAARATGSTWYYGQGSLYAAFSSSPSLPIFFPPPRLSCIMTRDRGGKSPGNCGSVGAWDGGTNGHAPRGLELLSVNCQSAIIRICSINTDLTDSQTHKLTDSQTHRLPFRPAGATR